MINKLISICLPTYNGAKTIIPTLESIIQEIEKVKEFDNLLEIIITDDHSKDNTVSVLKPLIEKHHYIRFFENKKNLGMDLNFRQSALNANGEYIWFCGQDDIFLNGVVGHIVKSLKNNPKISIININYSQYSEETKKVICPSMFHLQAYDPSHINFKKDLLFNNSAQYFQFFSDPPSFLPATIMKKKFWVTTNISAYYGTAYSQYANILLNMKNNKILAITKPYIKGLIPANGWQKNGNKLFSIQLGIMKARALVFLDSRNPMPLSLFQEKKIAFLKNFIRVNIASYHYGFKPTAKNYEDLIFIYSRFLCYIYLFPIIFLVGLIPGFILSSSFRIKSFYNK